MSLQAHLQAYMAISVPICNLNTAHSGPSHFGNAIPIGTY